jgi:hypothetical protein
VIVAVKQEPRAEKESKWKSGEGLWQRGVKGEESVASGGKG